MRYIKIFVIGIFSLFTSCIENDIPYPVVELGITNVEGDGFTMASTDNLTRIVTLNVDENTDIQNVNITNVEYTEKATISPSPIGGFDMRTPLDVTLSLYQDYDWSIVANQDIKRSFKVEGQIGTEVFDIPNKTVTVQVSKTADIENLNVTELYLGPKEITTMEPELSSLKNFSSYRQVFATYHGREEQWRLYVEVTDILVALTQCDVLTTVAFITASGDVSNGYGICYRKAGDTEWVKVADDKISLSGGSFSTSIEELSPSTEYEFIAYLGKDISDADADLSQIIKETTGNIVQLENGGFEDWNKPDKSWYPYLQGGAEFWATGNPGATTVGESNNLTTGIDDPRPGSSGSKAAQLQSRNVIVKFAAGNLFIGKFIGVDGVSDGVVGFGQPFTERPRALKGWVKYNQGVIDLVGDIPFGVDIVKDVTKDVGMIYIALGNWTPENYGSYIYKGEMSGTLNTPYTVATKDESTFYKPGNGGEIAYGEKVMNESITEWQEFTIPLNYHNYTTIPTHLIIVCSASRYGDYYTGSSESVMVLDDFELIY